MYELKLFEWDYVASLGDDDGEPDLDISDGPELTFTIGGSGYEPATATASATASQLRGGAHHQPGTQGTPGEDCMPMHAGNYKIYSGHGQGSGSGGTADTREYPASTGEYQYHHSTGSGPYQASIYPAAAGCTSTGSGQLRAQVGKDFRPARLLPKVSDSGTSDQASSNFGIDSAQALIVSQLRALKSGKPF